MADPESTPGHDPDHAELADLARRGRLLVLETVAASGAGHIGGPLSAMDILIALYFRVLRVRPFGRIGQEFGVLLFKGVGDVLQKDQTEHDMLVLGGIHVVAELVRRRPQRRLKTQRRTVAVRRRFFTFAMCRHVFW